MYNSDYTNTKLFDVQCIIYLFGVLHHFQHCTGHITTGSWKGRGNQYIQFVRVLYCKLLTNGKQLPAFPCEAVRGTEPWPQRWEARVLPLSHRVPFQCIIKLIAMCRYTKPDVLFSDVVKRKPVSKTAENSANTTTVKARINQSKSTGKVGNDSINIPFYR